MILLRFIIFLFIFTLTAYLPSTVQADHIPECTTGMNYESKAFDDNLASGHECPGETYCYSRLTAGNITSYGCHKKSSTTNTQTDTSIPADSEASDLLTISIEGSGIRISTSRPIKDTGTYRLSIVPKNTSNIIPPTFIFQVDGSGCKDIQRDLNSWPETNCSYNPADNSWSLTALRNKVLANGDYEAIINGGNLVPPLKSAPLTVGPAPSEDLKVSVNPGGPFDNTTINSVKVSWEPGVPGQRFFINTTITNLETLPIITCSSSPCSFTLSIPKGAQPGTKEITVAKEGQEYTVFGNTKIIISGDITTTENTSYICSGSDCTRGSGESCDNNTGLQTAIGCIHTDPKALIEDLLKLATGIGGGIAFLLMIFGAFRMITSQGNPQELKEGQEIFTNAIIGLLFIIFSVLLMQIIGVNILNLPGFS